MRKNSMGELFVAMLAFVGFVVCISLLCGAFESKPKCMKAGCEMNRLPEAVIAICINPMEVTILQAAVHLRIVVLRTQRQTVVLQEAL